MELIKNKCECCDEPIFTLITSNVAIYFDKEELTELYHEIREHIIYGDE